VEHNLPGVYLMEMLNRIDWVMTAKAVLIAFFWVAIVVGLWISLNFQRWYEQLVRMERTALLDRDEAMFIFTSIRSRLADIRERTAEMPEQTVLTQGVRSALTMLVKGERNPFQWGMLGLKLARSAWKVLKEK
jgi:hypothetical protein